MNEPTITSNRAITPEAVELTHDVRSALAAVVSSLGLLDLGTGEVSGEAREFLDAAQRNVWHLATLLGSALCVPFDDRASG
jgi:hypothetical protein